MSKQPEIVDPAKLDEFPVGTRLRCAHDKVWKRRDLSGDVSYEHPWEYRTDVGPTFASSEYLARECAPLQYLGVDLATEPKLTGPEQFVDRHGNIWTHGTLNGVSEWKHQGLKFDRLGRLEEEYGPLEAFGAKDPEPNRNGLHAVGDQITDRIGHTWSFNENYWWVSKDLQRAYRWLDILIADRGPIAFVHGTSMTMTVPPPDSPAGQAIMQPPAPAHPQVLGMPVYDIPEHTVVAALGGGVFQLIGSTWKSPAGKQHTGLGALLDHCGGEVSVLRWGTGE